MLRSRFSERLEDVAEQSLPFSALEPVLEQSQRESRRFGWKIAATGGIGAG